MRFIYFLFTYVFSLTAAAQLVVQVPQNLQGQVLLYAYYPQHTHNQPLQQASLQQGKAVLPTQGLQPGMYSLYFTTNNTLDKAPYIDVLVLAEEQNVELYWVPGAKWVQFINAPINQSFYEQKKTWLHYKEEDYYLQQAQQLFANSASQLHIQQKVKAVQDNADALAQKFLSNTLVWDDYLATTATFKQAKTTYQNFWEQVTITNINLWSTPYQNEVLAAWWQRCRQQETSPQTQQEMYITGIVQHLGKNKQLHPFLMDWLHQTYDYNRNNDLFVFGLKAMLALPDADAALKTVWQTKVQKLQPLNKGQTMNLSAIEQQGLLSEKDTVITLILYSETCGGCVEVLKQVNDLKNAPGQIAIRVKAAAANESIINEKEYPNITFFHPQDTSAYQPYVQRGTPALVFLKKIGNDWQIQGME
jgi:hypothetical protein